MSRRERRSRGKNRRGSKRKRRKRVRPRGGERRGKRGLKASAIKGGARAKNLVKA